MSVKERDAATGYETTGHDWNGIAELNTNVPRVVWWCIIVTHLYALLLWVLLPAWPYFTGYTKGVLGVDQTEQLAVQVAAAELPKAVWADRIAAVSVDEMRADAGLMQVVHQTAPALFGDKCAACHGVNAMGGPGFPNLVDGDWLWGGDADTILETLRVGINSAHPDTRFGQMLAFGRDGILTRPQIRQVVGYVQSLSGTQIPAETVTAGAVLFQENCISCHGEDAKGLKELGAPNLTDDIWLYGKDDAAMFATVYGGRQGVMPTWESQLGLVDRKILTAYLLDLGPGAKP